MFIIVATGLLFCLTVPDCIMFMTHQQVWTGMYTYIMSKTRLYMKQFSHILIALFVCVVCCISQRAVAF
jgi:hypothetical protein